MLNQRSCAGHRALRHGQHAHDQKAMACQRQRHTRRHPLLDDQLDDPAALRYTKDRLHTRRQHGAAVLTAGDGAVRAGARSAAFRPPSHVRRITVTVRTCQTAAQCARSQRVLTVRSHTRQGAPASGCMRARREAHGLAQGPRKQREGGGTWALAFDSAASAWAACAASTRVERW